MAIFDERHQRIGENTREFIHRQGLWHETFHCWFVHIEEGVPLLYFQRRSKAKKDFPNLFDITAAGHLLENETVQEGVREVKEELGVGIGIHDLNSIGVIKDTIVHSELIDNEFAHTFVYIIEATPIFHLQREEVSGIFSSPISDVEKLYNLEVDEISLKPIVSDVEETIEIKVTLEDFVPHGAGYMEQVLDAIRPIGG